MRARNLNGQYGHKPGHDHSSLHDGDGAADYDLMDVMLTEDERSCLKTHEAVIERGLKTFYEVGAALLEIRDGKLYRETHATFEDYCRERWQLKQSHTYRLMDAASVIENLKSSPNGGTLPDNERQIRPLTSLPPEQQAEAWKEALETAPDGKVTAAHVEATVQRIHYGPIEGDYQPDVPSVQVEVPIPEVNAATPPKNLPHVARNSGENEWYTPPHIIAAARAVMGAIDCDPASTALANGIVNATTYYTVDDDGLQQAWRGRVWLNPPYAQPLISQFAQKFAAEYEAGNIEQACVLVNNATETGWFRKFLNCAQAICLVDGRVKFLDPNMNPGAPLQGQILLYVGANVDSFGSALGALGAVLYVH